MSVRWETEGLQTVGIVCLVIMFLKLMHLLGLIDITETGETAWDRRCNRERWTLKDKYLHSFKCNYTKVCWEYLWAGSFADAAARKVTYFLKSPLFQAKKVFIFSARLISVQPQRAVFLGSEVYFLDHCSLYKGSMYLTWFDLFFFFSLLPTVCLSHCSPFTPFTPPFLLLHTFLFKRW